jgi:hypothetical protein
MKISKMPKTKPARTDDGVSTGMLVTLQDSVALCAGKELHVPSGTLITSPISTGESWQAGVVTRTCKMEDGREVAWVK